MLICHLSVFFLKCEFNIRMLKFEKFKKLIAILLRIKQANKITEQTNKMMDISVV